MASHAVKAAIPATMETNQPTPRFYSELRTSVDEIRRLHSLTCLSTLRLVYCLTGIPSIPILFA